MLTRKTVLKMTPEFLVRDSIRQIYCRKCGKKLDGVLSDDYYDYYDGKHYRNIWKKKCPSSSWWGMNGHTVIDIFCE